MIFQPELRRMLGNWATCLSLPLPASSARTLKVIIQTCERLAEVRIGALIAIEQSIQLQEAVESGIPIDCEATPEMLETIFFPNNAIHDGGVILKGDRIAYAACIFRSRNAGFEQVPWHAASGRHRPERGNGRGGYRCVRGDRRDFIRRIRDNWFAE
jgi:DNA integrity scanning protein DisA with diadenylate cyclase activity